MEGGATWARTQGWNPGPSAPALPSLPMPQPLRASCASRHSAQLLCRTGRGHRGTAPQEAFWLPAVLTPHLCFQKDTGVLRTQFFSKPGKNSSRRGWRVHAAGRALLEGLKWGLTGPSCCVGACPEEPATARTGSPPLARPGRPGPRAHGQPRPARDGLPCFGLRSRQASATSGRRGVQAAVVWGAGFPHLVPAPWGYDSNTQNLGGFGQWEPTSRLWEPRPQTRGGIRPALPRLDWPPAPCGQGSVFSSPRDTCHSAGALTPG